MYYNVLYNNRNTCNFIYNNNKCNRSICSLNNIYNNNNKCNRSICSLNNIYNNNNNNNNNESSNTYKNENTSNNNSINIDILQNIKLSETISNNNFNVYNAIFTFKYNKLVLLKNKNSKFGFIEIMIPTFNKNTDNLYILLNVNINDKYATNVHILNNEGLIEDFDLLKKKYFIESKYLNGTNENITKKYTISFQDDICIIENFNIYFLGKLSDQTEEKIDDSNKDDEIITTKEDNSVTTFEEEKLKYTKKNIYNNNFNSIDKLSFYNLKNPKILMNNGLWSSIINKKNIFCISPKVPFFFDTSFQYYLQLEYYVTNGGILDLKAFNNKKIDSNPISSNISNKNGILIKKLKELNNPFFFYSIYGLTSCDVVLKNLEIFYFIKENSINNTSYSNINDDNDNDNDNHNDNDNNYKIIKSISAIGDGITVESGGQLIV